VTLVRSYNCGRPVGHDPWQGSTLEWFALSPPPPHNFDAVPDVRSAEPLHDIREAIREREAAFVPPAPLEVSGPPEVGVPDPGDDAGMSEEAAATDAPTADPDDIVAEEAPERSDEGSHTEAPEPGSDPSTPEAEDTQDAGEGSDPTDASASDPTDTADPDDESGGGSPVS
jgi:hypothetical protein